MADPEPVDLSTLPGHLIRRAEQRHVALWKAHGPTGLTGPQYAVLHALLQHPLIDQTTLGELTSLDRSTLGELVGRLADRGLVARRRDRSDARRNAIELTPAGRRTCQGAAERVAEVNRRLVARLDPAERRRLTHLLARLVGAEDATS